MEKEEILNDYWRKFRLSIGLDPNEKMSGKAIDNFSEAMDVYNKSSLMKFIGSLQDRGLLSKSMSEMDYEFVVWDFLKKQID